MKLGYIVALGVGLILTGSPASAEVHVTMKGGRVSIVAKDATLRQILTEWARVGQTKIVNVERIPGAPLTLELIDVPEEQALDVLLRPLSGYMAAPRSQPIETLSLYDRIIVMPTLASARPAPTGAPPPPVFQPPPQMAPSVEHDADDQPQPGAPGQNPQGPRGPVFNAFPPPQVVNPQQGQQPMGQPGYVPPAGFPQGSAPAARPSGFPTSSPGGVAVPGMIVPAPQQPGQPGQPVRPGGGSN